jgi:hypothetical protein
VSKGKKLLFRDGVEFTALLGSPLEKHELGQAIAVAIKGSPLRGTSAWIDRETIQVTPGLQPVFDLQRTPELFFRLVLNSTGDTPEREVKDLLQSIPGVYQVRELSTEKVRWSEHDEKYMIDFPDDDGLSIPSGAEFDDRASDSVLEDIYDYDSELPIPNPASMFDGCEIAPPPLSAGQVRSRQIRNRRIRNRKAAWKHRQTGGARDSVK